jgi:hypothetical protein
MAAITFSLFRKCLVTLFLLGALLCALLIGANWGTGQPLTPHLLESRLNCGMTSDEVESRLSFRTGELRKQLNQANSWPDGTRAFNISEPGLGSCLRVQTEVTLWFDAQDRLRRGWIKFVDCVHEDGREMSLAD